ncbi:MAG: hypothetical protein WCK27_25030 [Verrucomicrobiota bacterium]
MPSPFDPLSPSGQAPGLPYLRQPLSLLPAPSLSTEPTRRVVFISHSHLHESETQQFLKDFQARRTIADRIVNPSDDMLTNNAKCRICGVTH